MYELIGRWVVTYVRRRYAAQIRFAAAFGLAAVAIGAYLASRENEDQ